MQGIPTFLSGNAIVIKRTPNGYAVCEDKGAPAETCPAFETWEALVSYIEANFVNHIA